MVDMTRQHLDDFDRGQEQRRTAAQGAGSDADPDNLLQRTPESLTSRLTFARLDAEHALEKLTRIMTVRGDLSAVLNTSQGTWCYVPHTPKHVIPPRG